jgi:serine/threonine-protein kinase
MFTPVLLDNRYELMAPVNAGAMGSVFQARDLRLGKVVAVKIMKTIPGLSDGDYSERRFREEARLLASLSHRGLPGVTDYFIEKGPGQQAGAHCLVMEFIEGQDGQTMMEDRGGVPLPLQPALGYFMDLLGILHYLHSLSPPVIFRDLNPRNIMLARRSLYLVDFGIAIPYNPDSKGTAIGTPGYVAPEQYRGEAEPRSDLFSLGVTMHYFLSGRDPEKGHARNFTFEPLGRLNSFVPGRLEALITAMIDIVPSRRPRSARAAMEEVQQIMRCSRQERPSPPSIRSFRNITPPLPGGGQSTRHDS